MCFLCQEPYKILDEARKRVMEVGRANYDSIHKEHYGLFFKKTVYVVLWWNICAVFDVYLHWLAGIS